MDKVLLSDEYAQAVQLSSQYADYSQCQALDRLAVMSTLVPEIVDLDQRTLTTMEDVERFWKPYVDQVGGSEVAKLLVHRMTLDNVLGQAPHVAHELRHATAEHFNDVIVYVRSASPLPEKAFNDLHALVQKKLAPGLSPLYWMVPDASCLGGVAIYTKGGFYDGSALKAVNTVHRDIMLALFG
jgi:F0F1-type ATP synthase delta subunit